MPQIAVAGTARNNIYHDVLVGDEVRGAIRIKPVSENIHGGGGRSTGYQGGVGAEIKVLGGLSVIPAG